MSRPHFMHWWKIVFPLSGLISAGAGGKVIRLLSSTVKKMATVNFRVLKLLFHFGKDLSILEKVIVGF